MEDTTMTKKIYLKPEMEVVKIQQQCQILAGSLDANGMNNELLDVTVEEGWASSMDDMIEIND
jgi:hypothetical protein